MGWEVRECHLSFLLDSHAGELERRDEALYDEVTNAIEGVLALPQYAHLHSVEVPEPDALPPAVRWRAVLALLEAAERLAAGREFGNFVAGNVVDVLTQVREAAEVMAFAQVGEAVEYPGGNVRLVGEEQMNLREWLEHVGRKPGRV